MPEDKVDKSPKGAKRFVWNGNPLKLHMTDVPHPEEGHRVLRFHDEVELTPEQQKRYATYIEKGLLSEEPLPTMPRLSPHSPPKAKPEPEPKEE